MLTFCARNKNYPKIPANYKTRRDKNWSYGPPVFVSRWQKLSNLPNFAQYKLATGKPDGQCEINFFHGLQ